MDVLKKSHGCTKKNSMDEVKFIFFFFFRKKLASKANGSSIFYLDALNRSIIN